MSIAIGDRAAHLPLELTTFVGRRTELAEAGRLLGTDRLVAVTGRGEWGRHVWRCVAAQQIFGHPDDLCCFLTLGSPGSARTPAEPALEPGLELRPVLRG
ncbi:hypothetical protein [Rhodococcus wratislaviensis]|uniref:hypothetical protein n=1 Tax=Rhodococcus wratislaviensis TaxID=44752 RepID=UPI003654ED45